MSYLFPVPVKKLTSAYSGDLYITIENGRRVLNTATVNYSYHSLHRVFQHAFKQSGLAVDHIQHTLLLGLGGGSVVEILRKNYQLHTPIHAVELDPQIIRVAVNEFGIEQYAPLRIIEADALDYIQTCSQLYQLICVDLFINEVVPAPFLTISFIEKLISLTDDGGIIYFNIMVSHAESKIAYTQLYQYLVHKTNPSLTRVTVCETEETNRVLVIRK